MKAIVLIFAGLLCFSPYSQEGFGDPSFEPGLFNADFFEAVPVPYDGGESTLIDGISVPHGPVLDAVQDFFEARYGAGKDGARVLDVKPVFFGSGVDWQHLDVSVEAVNPIEDELLYTWYACRVFVPGSEGRMAAGFRVGDCRLRGSASWSEDEVPSKDARLSILNLIRID